jgi:hypothetical protein
MTLMSSSKIYGCTAGQEILCPTIITASKKPIFEPLFGKWA